MDVEASSSSGKSLPLPDAFVDFLNENGLDPSIYVASDSTPRYVRLKPGFEAHVEEIEAEIKCKLETLSWLPNFYCLPPGVGIASSKSYQEGMIYGIDAASGAAVSGLDVSSGDHILDLCAAPGAKLCMILDLLGNSGSVTGVDISRHRLTACRTMLQKYALGDRCRLFVADGTKFSLIPIRVHSDSTSCESTSGEKLETYKEWTSRRPWKERKRASKVRENSSKFFSGVQEPELIYYGQNSGVVGFSKNEVYQSLTSSEVSRYGYDKVLVDAECTHDGSIRHIQKFEQWGWETLKRRVLDAERTDNLTVLQTSLPFDCGNREDYATDTFAAGRVDKRIFPVSQLQLLTNGFRLLKVGGFLVYSTCSLTFAQNEDVVEQFLAQNACAELVEIDAAKAWPCSSGRIPKTLRFNPLTSGTSGLFVAKFTKLAT